MTNNDFKTTIKQKGFRSGSLTHPCAACGSEQVEVTEAQTATK